MARERKPRRKAAEWSDDIPDRAYKLALAGLTNEQLAIAFGVSLKRFEYWKRTEDLLRIALERGREKADSEIAHSLFKRAKGFWVKETKVFVHKGEVITQDVDKYIIPDTEALKFWLKNRQPALWNDTFKHEHSGKVEVENKKFDLTDLSEEEFELVQKLGMKEMLRIENDESEE